MFGKDSKLISVIMPAYNAQDTIAYSVRSVIAQSYEDWELVVCSDDGVDYREILKSHNISDSRIVFTSTGKVGSGAANARNVALEKARGDIIALLDADDAFFRHKLKRCLPFVEGHGFVMTGMYFSRKTSGGYLVIEKNSGLVGNRAIGLEEYGYINFLGSSFSVFDRTRVPTRWRTELPVMEDVIFGFEAYNYLPHIFFVDEPLHIYVKRADSLTNSVNTTEQFLTTKKYLLSWLEKNVSSYTQQVASAIKDFLTISLEAEIINSKKENPDDFLDLFRNICQQHSIALPIQKITPALFIPELI